MEAGVIKPQRISLIDAPVLETLDLIASGGYDDYSSGQTNFSPKVGFKFSPIDSLALRGTWSQGFRIPSFNEAFGLPTTGYVTSSAYGLYGFNPARAGPNIMGRFFRIGAKVDFE